MEYTCYYDEWNEIKDQYRMTLDPKEFLDCSDEEELNAAIRETMYDYGPIDTAYLECYDSDLTIPNEFIEEWKQLKEKEE